MGFKKYKEKLILLGGTIGIGVISLFITLTVYNVKITKSQNSNENELNANNEIVFNQELTEAQKLVAKNLIEELENLKKNTEDSKDLDNKENINEKNMGVIENEQSDVDVLTSNDSKVEVSQNNNKKEGTYLNADKKTGGSIVDDSEKDLLKADENQTNILKEGENKVIETIAQVKKEISFIKPIEDGKLGMIFSDERLVYSKTLEEWLTHKAVDFLAPVDTLVKATTDGVISSMYDDKKYGFTIVIEHEDGYVSKYSGVLPNEDIKEGDNVKKGEGIGKIAKPSGFEAADGSHLHFELLKDDINIEPNFN